MKRTESKIVAIFVLSLFLLGNSPIANLSKNIRGTALSPFVTSLGPTEETEPETSNFLEISAPDKHSFSDLSFRTEKTASLFSSSVAASSISEASTSASLGLGDFISIAGVTIPLFTATPVNNYLPDSGNSVGVYNQKFLYGHNISNVFAGLHNLRVGDTFSITSNGTTAHYQVAVSEVLSKDSLDQSTLESKSILWQIYNAKYRGDFDISLMTCAGVSYSGGDASHRLVIMASRI